MRRDSVVPCLLVLLPLLCVGPMGCARAMHGEEAVEEEEYPVEPPPFVLEQLKERDLPYDHNVNAPLRPRGLRDTERTPLPVEDLQEEEGVVAAPRVVHTCIHDALMEQYKDTIQTVEQEDGKKKRDPLPRSLEEALSLDPSRVRKIRIKPVFDLLYEDVDACFSTRSGDGYASGGRRYACTQKSQVLTSTKRNFIITVVNEAIDWLERALYLEPMSSLRLSSFSSTAKCLEMTIPGSIFTATHTDADYLLFVTGRPTSGSVLAWAGGCFRDASTGRPIAGQANFGPNAVDVDGEAPDKYVGTAIHELMHALGFSSGWFPEDVFRHTSGISAKALGKTIYRIRSPRVKEEVRSHFGCSASEWSFAGAELEDGGGSGSVGSHFEKRIFMDEIMTATIALNPIISRITLATFEDTGWYLVDYNQAEVNPWGRHTGTSCFFARNSCLSWPDEYFCASKTSRLCTTDTTSRGYCNLASFSTSLPSNVRYFTKSTLGGSDSYADYCPYQAVLKDCRINRGPFSPSLEIWAEKFGSRSRCFVSTLIKSGWSVPGASTHGGCHKTLCSSSGRLLILLEPTGYYWYCPRYGGRICDFEGYGGCITCPPSADVCTGCADNDNCNDRGTCVNGECVCGPGWGGKDCSKALYDSTIFRDVESVVFTPLRAQTVTSFTIPDGEFRDYDILVPSAGVNISIIAEIDTGDVDMYVNPPTSIETLPDRTHNIWRSDSVGNITEEVAIYGETDWYFATGIYKIALYSDAPGGSTGRITVSIDCPFINGTTERHECLDVLAFCPNGCSLHGLCQDFGDNGTEDFRCSCFPSWNCTKMDDTDEVKRTERCDCENRQPASAVLDAGDVNKERTVVVAIGVSVVTLAILLAVGIAIYHSTVVAARKAEEKALEMERRAVVLEGSSRPLTIG